jgi:hypothetical protein
VRFGVLVLLGLFLAACSGGLRPTLVVPPTAASLPPLELDLPPAPETVAPIAPAPMDLTLESSVDDALLAWALDRSIPYAESCIVATPAPNELCDSPTERDTVRLLGPSATNIWYVVTIDEVSSFDSGVGYRVSGVDIAGR